MKDEKQHLSIAFSASKFADRRSETSILEHQLEFVARINQVNYINDSKATTVADTWNSLHAMPGNVILLMGGMDRGNDYKILKGIVKEKVKAIICLGAERDKIFSALLGNGLLLHAASLDEAVKFASLYGQAGDVVLFSPACPSYDAFDNYKNRGNKFKHLVSTL
ncbi:MAG TPA: cyanophycin synthetase [Bacteroidia bacterium]|jgi:UDP-N-acetylmuramoylalanine--D-glutamate ligase|nr:cyanophycin synthetase [Bacteroidia bacterium]